MAVDVATTDDVFNLLKVVNEVTLKRIEDLITVNSVTLKRIEDLVNSVDAVTLRRMTDRLISIEKKIDKLDKD
jgi:hypothetical protein